MTCSTSTSSVRPWREWALRSSYFCHPIAPGGLVTTTAIFVQAASEADVKAVVNMSQISARRDAKSNSAQQHWLAERVLDRYDFITTHLRPTFFAEWFIWQWRRDGDSGVLQLPFGNGRHAPIAAFRTSRCHCSDPAEPGTA